MAIPLAPLGVQMTDFAEALQNATRLALGACDECQAKWFAGAMPIVHAECTRRLNGAVVMIERAERTCEVEAQET